MHQKYNFLFFFLAFSISSCNTNNQRYSSPLVPAKVILNGQTDFINYWQSYLNLSPPFIGIDNLNNEISKKQFLEKIASGKFLPLRLISDSSAQCYKLFKINGTIDNYISILLKSIGMNEYKNYLWEGRYLPKINYFDLVGKRFDSQTIKGKILVLDFWFIGCSACVADMPMLNEIVNKYRNRKDICFVAIAFNKAPELKRFLEKIKFQYRIISDTANYLVKKLQITSFPTEVIIDKEGKVMKILNDQYHRLENLNTELKIITK